MTAEPRTRVNRLSGFDAGMLAIESVSVPMTAGSLWKLNWATVPGGYRFERFRAALAERIPALPELRMKLADHWLNLDTPVWVDDHQFDLDHHVHRISLPLPGTRTQLVEAIERLLVNEMDRHRPLWDIWAIEGLSADLGFDGGVAVMHRFHHALVDGTSAHDIFSRLCGTSADSPPPLPRGGVGAATRRQIVLGGIARFVLRPWRLLTAVLPAAIRSIRTAGIRSDRPHAPPTPLNGNVSGRRGVAYGQFDLADVKAVKNAVGGTVNDVVLAVVSNALRDYLQAREALPASSLTAGIPVAIETGRVSRNNLAYRVCPLFTDLPDPIDRLAAISAASADAKRRETGAGSTLMLDLWQYLPGLLTFGMRFYKWSGLAKRMPLYNLTVSNVVSPQPVCFLTGAEVEARFVFGPVFNGAGLCITVLTLGDRLNIGLVSCGDMLPHDDLHALADSLPTALRALLARVLPEKKVTT